MQFDYASYEYGLAATQLVLSIVGMGVTLSPRDFWNVLRAPQGVALVVALQWLVVPWLAIGLAQWAGLPEGLAIGMILVAALPGGSLSNLFTHLGRGNVPLSITATTVCTAACLVTTPLVFRLYAGGELAARLEMPIGRLALEIAGFVLLPLAAAMFVGRRFPALREPIARWGIRGAIVILAIIVAGSLGSGHLDLSAYGPSAPTVLLSFGLIVLAASYGLGLLLGFTLADSFTIAIEATLRNGSLGLLLKAAMFPATPGMADALGDAVLYAVLFYTGASLGISAGTVAVRELRHRRQSRMRQALPTN